MFTVVCKRQLCILLTLADLCVCQGHMVAKGTYTELQQSGLDFTSLLKKEEEEEQQQPPPHDVPSRSRTLSQNSSLSQASSVQSVKDGDHLPVSMELPVKAAMF